MPESLLGLLKLCLLVLLYLFFARVLWAVWTEVQAVRPQPDAAGPAGLAKQAEAMTLVGPAGASPASRTG